MITVYCLETDNSYEVNPTLFDKLLVQRIIWEMTDKNSYFPKFVFMKKDLSHIITKTNG